MIRELIEADPRLRYSGELSDVERARIHGVFAALSSCYLEFAPELPRSEQYVHLVVWELRRAAMLLPDVHPIVMAVERDAMLLPYDAPGQAEVRATVTMIWLRHELGIDSACGKQGVMN